MERADMHELRYAKRNGSMDNSALNRAQRTRYDEYYTRRIEIEEELCHYWEQLEGKIVYCNCDRPGHSEFYSYFADNFYALKLKKLIATYYEPGTKPAYATILTEEGMHVYELDGNGDFRSDECVQFLQEADVIITNPPFSLFREYICLLMKYEKKFLIICNIGAITYKCCFPLLKNNAVWSGYNQPRFFSVEEGPDVNLGIARWYTNLAVENKVFHPCRYEYHTYRHYDSFPAIDCPKCSLIPTDYDGYIGAPVSYTAYLPNDTFEIVGNRHDFIEEAGLKFTHFINGRETYRRILIRKKKEK
jgi:hypothetical protein